MNLPRLVTREIAFRKLTFLISLAAIAAAVACSCAALLLLDDHGQRTAEIVEEHERKTVTIVAGHAADLAALVKKHEDETRKTMKKLGFNVLILPLEQKLEDLYADDFATKYMPESYVDKLANSSIMTVNHLLPSLTQKLVWPEEQRTIIVIGVRGEVPIHHRDPKKPLLDAVPKGKAVLGYELHQKQGRKVGDKITLKGQEFEVAKGHPQRGTKDDITIWIDLATAQEMFGKQGKVNAILALECNCAADRLAVIREEIAGILPDTQVIERGSRATARAEQRAAAKKHAERALADAKANRDELLGQREANRDKLFAQREAFAAMLVPLVLVGAALLVGVLAFLNVRDRHAEIGVLRALGVGGARIVAVFLGKALVVGAIGGAIGFPLGLAIASGQGESAAAQTGLFGLFDATLLVVVLVAAPLVAVLASWLPALIAAQQDPAIVLRDT